MEKIAITANLGMLRAYRLKDEDPLGRKSLEEVKEFDMIEGVQKTAEIYSDQAGKFNGKDYGGSSYESKFDLENERGLIKSIADILNDFIQKNSDTKFYLAISDPISKKLVESLDENTKDKIAKVVAKDLTKQTKEDILKEFFE
ncbi:MAG: host attachment protein [Campylobacterales bacterium]